MSETVSDPTATLAERFLRDARDAHRPVSVYLISGFRWSFYGAADVHIGVSVGMTLVFLTLCLLVISWIFRTGYRIKP